VGCCEESDFTACVGERALLGRWGTGATTRILPGAASRGECACECAAARVYVKRSWCGCQRIAALEFCPGRAWLVEAVGRKGKARFTRAFGDNKEKVMHCSENLRGQESA
jgi:hypothetical protein